MFVVKIDIWPHGDWTRPIQHTTIVACNDGTGTGTSGNYQAIALPDAASICEADLRMMLMESMTAGETTKVKAFPRGHDQHHLPALVSEIIDCMGYREFLAA